MRIAGGDTTYLRGVELANPDVEMNGDEATTGEIVGDFFSKGEGPRIVAAFRMEETLVGSRVPGSRVVAIIDQKTREVAVFEGDTNRIFPGDEAKKEFEDMDKLFSGRDRINSSSTKDVES